MKRFPRYALLVLLLLTGSFGLQSHFKSGPVADISPTLKKNLLLTPELIEEYAAKLDAILLTHDFKGTIAVALNGKLVYSKSGGYADMGGKLKNDSTTMFQLASVSKQFTAMGIALLKNKNMLTYDDTVKKYIPEFPYNNITIKHLLTHTSGMQNYVWLIENDWKKTSFPNNEDLIDLFVKNPLPLNFLPGSKFKYSNTGYAMLASVIERVSGKHYGIFLNENIFQPLGMTRSFVYKKGITDTIQGTAKGYVRRSGRYVHYENDFNDGIVGDKGIYSCIDDMLRWDAALYSDILLPADALAEMFNYNTTNNGDTVHYGYGFRLPKTPYPSMVYHNGWWHGYRATFRRYTGDRNTLIILNNTNQNIYPIISEIEGFLYPQMICDTLGKE